ncbi:hypothetical protein Esti_003394 [Eimeria stiedai]
MTLQARSVGQRGPVTQSLTREGGATLAPLKSHLKPQQECSTPSKESIQQACLADCKMGATSSAPQDAIDLSCLPEEFVEGLHSVAEVKKHMQDGKYELGERSELPQASGSRVTVFIDVDETVVYVTPIPLLKVPADRTFAFSEPTGEDKDLRAYTATPLPPLTLEEAAAAAQNFDPNAPQAILYVYYRPFVKRFLTELRSTGNFEIIAFTAALPEYANPILDTLEEEEKLFDHRLYRRHCCRAPRTRSLRVELPSGGDSQWSFTGEVFYYVKDLAHAAPNRDLRRCVLLDNSPVSFAAQMENGIYLRPFCGDPGDDELQFLAKMLCQLHKLEDIRAGLHTGLINAAWRSLVEQDELYEIAGIPEPPAPKLHTSVEDLLMAPEAFKPEKPRDLLQEARKMRYDLSETASRPVSGELPWIDDSPNSVKDSQKDDREDDIIAAVAASREFNGQQFDERALKTGSSLSLWHASSSVPCAAPKGKDALSSLAGRRSVSQVSVQPSRVSKRTAAKEATPGPASSAISNRHSGQVAPKKRGGPRTPRSAGPRDEQDPSHYNTCFEVGRARKEAADTRSVVNSCRSTNGYHGESRRSLASSSDSAVTRRVDESNHTISCLKRQEREGTTWCSCAGNKSSTARTFNREGSKRHVAWEPFPRSGGDSFSRRASERRLLLRRARDSSEEKTSDPTYVGSPAYEALPSRTLRGSRVPRLQLQGVASVAHGEETSEFSSEEGLGEEPLTPGRPPLTPGSRKARLVNIEQILEDSVALSRQQCPEPVAQSRNRLKQPATLYGCPDIQAPNLICGMQHGSFGSNSQGRPRSRPLATTPRRGGQGDVSPRGPTSSSHGNLQDPFACTDGPSQSTQPYTLSQYPGFPIQEVQQQLQPNPAAAWDDRMAARANAPTPQGWAPATPLFADNGSTMDMSAAAFSLYNNAAYGKGSGQSMRSPSGFLGGVNAASSHPQQSAYMPTPRCATPAKEYASMRQQLTRQAHPWSASPGSSPRFGSWTPRMMGAQPHQNHAASVTTQPPIRQGAFPPSMAAKQIPQQPPKLFAGRRMRLGDLFGGCAESSVREASPQCMQKPQGNEDLLVRPAVLVKTEELVTFAEPRAQRHPHASLQPSASRPLIVPYVAGVTPHTARSPSSLHPARAPSLVASPRTCAGGISRGSLPPMMMGGRAPTHLGYPHTRQQGPSHFGFPSWPWTHQPTETPLSASMNVLPRFP